MIIGHEKQQQYFERLLKKGKLGHAYIFHGPNSVGKLAFAQDLIKKLSCPHPVILDLDKTLLSKKEERKKIPIEDIQELKRLFSLSAPGDQWRIAVIDGAEKLSDEASNAFLKILEEPGQNTLFILVTSAIDLLLPTVVSRARPVRFSHVPAETMRDYLKKKVPDQKQEDEILGLSFGRPGIMLRLIESADFLEGERKFLRSFQAAFAGGIPEIFRFSEKVAFDEEERAKTVEYLFRMARKSLVANPSLKTSSQIKKMQKIALALDTTNVNPRLALDVMMIEAHSNGR